MPTLTRLDCPTLLDPLRYEELSPSTVDDWELTAHCFTQRRPVPVGVVWGQRWVWLVGGN